VKPLGAMHKMAYYGVCLLLLCMQAVSSAQMPIPALTGHVIDQTGTLTREQRAGLEQTLTAFEARKGSQVALLLVASTAPETIEAYAIRVAEVWKLGRKKIDDGAILLVAKNDRTVRIEVGYGLEGALNDAISKRIIDQVIVPRFKQQEYFAGISDGLSQMMRVIEGEPLPAVNGASDVGLEGARQFAPALFIIALVVGGMLRRILGRVPGALITGSVVAFLAWLIIGGILLSLLAGTIALFLTLLSGNVGRSGMMGYGTGMGRGGGFGGGGFSGGGGGFGGGGASGRW
jgi:uncharacterized protein